MKLKVNEVRICEAMKMCEHISILHFRTGCDHLATVSEAEKDSLSGQA